ncbi:MAG: peptidylprolyl isomerase, partial [Candidatus Aenigmatarchaeota archaeon]
MKNGDIIRINYTGKIKESGEIFDTTDGKIAEEEGIKNPRINYGSVPVILGTEGLVKGLVDALMNMKVGEEKTIEIEPEKAFGDRKSELITTISEKKLKDQDITPAPGMTLNMGGREAKILSVNSGRVRIDMNHPLAGKVLIYDAKIEEKVEGKKDKIKEISEFYMG